MSMFIGNLQKESHTLNLKVKKYLEQTSKSQVNTSLEWEDTLLGIENRKALTCVAVVTSAFVNVYMAGHERLYEENSTKFLHMSKQLKIAIDVIQSLDVDIYQEAARFAQRILRLYENQMR